MPRHRKYSWEKPTPTPRSRTKHGRLRHGPKTNSRTYTRFGAVGPVEKGAVVRFFRGGASSGERGWGKGIVLKLEPWDSFSRAYGRQAVVYDPKTKNTHEVGVGDMQILGYVKRMPKRRRTS